MKSGHMKIAGIALASLGLLASVDSASAACRSKSSPVSAIDNAPGTVAMTTDNKQCMLQFASHKETKITKSVVVDRPKNGSVNHVGRYGLEYTAKAGYKGDDAFSISVCATHKGKNGCSLIAYKVVVK